MPVLVTYKGAMVSLSVTKAPIFPPLQFTSNLCAELTECVVAPINTFPSFVILIFSDQVIVESALSDDRDVRRSRRRRYKEAEEVKCPQLLTVAGSRAWKNLVYQNINSASGRPDDKALEWAMEVED